MVIAFLISSTTKCMRELNCAGIIRESSPMATVAEDAGAGMGLMV